MKRRYHVFLFVVLCLCCVLFLSKDSIRELYSFVMVWFEKREVLREIVLEHGAFAPIAFIFLQILALGLVMLFPDLVFAFL